MTRPILTLLAFALFAPLAARAQIHVIGSGSVMMPVWMHGARLIIWEDDILTVHEGDLIARHLGPHIIGTRVVTKTPEGWVTRSDSAIDGRDDAYQMTESDYVGKVYPDSGARLARVPSALPVTRDLYILTRYEMPIGREVSNLTIRPNDPEQPHHVPDGGAFGAFALVVVAMCGVKRFLS